MPGTDALTLEANMKRFFAFVALSLALSGCGGGGSRTVPASDPGAPGLAPAMPAALRTKPASRDFARPVLPAALKSLKIADLTPATASALLAQRSALGSARSTQGRSTGFFANEVYVGPDANGFAAYWMPYFGFYTYAGTTPGTIPYPGFLYKYNFAWLYDFGGTNAGSSDAYFFDFGAPDGDIGVFYTSANYGSDANSMYLYDFMLNHSMLYQENSFGPRWFYDFATGAWLTGNKPLTESAGGAAAFVRPDNHKTLYYLDVDSASKQMCTGGCLSTWPALAPIPNSSPTADLTIVQRSDGGGKQWTNQGRPLYEFAGDGGPNQANGDGIPDLGGHWHIARPAGTAPPPPQPTEPPCRVYC
jgi:predicted lipoprotein with Yx(FWY)xxD motif